ncbi:CDP-diacylglycerol--glycerol-3-phosphate 3-phosphatidyltransferase [Sparganum proliferum]
MTRHSKNCTANTVYTYHERKKDAKHSGYGTQTVRLGKDSIRNFDCCCLTLQPAKDPVITPDGFLYDRAAILEYILSQKADIKRRQRIYEKQLDRAARELAEKKRAAREKEAREFMALNTLDTHSQASVQAAESEALANIAARRFTSVEHSYKPGSAASFWTSDPSSEASSSTSELEPQKPDTVVRCPMSGKALRYKDLITVNFTDVEVGSRVPLKAGESSIAQDVRRCCAVSKDLLSNSTPCVVLKTSGSVVKKEVVDMILKNEMVDPINGQKMTDSDFIEVQIGSGGFSDERSILTATRWAPSVSALLSDLGCADLPAIPVKPDQLRILTSPSAFYREIQTQLKKAKRRVIICTLYVGTGELEQALVSDLESAVKERSKYGLSVHLLVESTRSTRPATITRRYAGSVHRNETSADTRTPSSSIQLLTRLATLPGVTVSLYHSHKLRDWIRRLLPERINETVGLQHIKAYVFDDTVIVSGANLSDEYFTTRQDRAWVFSDLPPLADFYAGLADVISSLSYRLRPDGSFTAASLDLDPVVADASVYVETFRARLNAYLSDVRASLSSPRHLMAETLVMPLVQAGSYGVNQEHSLLLQILRRLPSLASSSSSCCSLYLTSGYFCPTDEFQDCLSHLLSSRPDSTLSLLCAAPEANSFFKSSGLSGGIPKAYRESLIAFLYRLTKALPSMAATAASSDRLRVGEYLRPGWTFHAKGLWVETNVCRQGDSKAAAAALPTTLAWIGSSNYGYRSRDRDLESQVLICTNNAGLRQAMREERMVMWNARYYRPVTLQDLSRQSEYRFQWYLRWVLPLLRRLM